MSLYCIADGRHIDWTNLSRTGQFVATELGFTKHGSSLFASCLGCLLGNVHLIGLEFARFRTSIVKNNKVMRRSSMVSLTKLDLFIRVGLKGNLN